MGSAVLPGHRTDYRQLLISSVVGRFPYRSRLNSTAVLASLSFHSSLIQYDWFYWLPLSLSQDNYITELTENISLPRMLIGVNKEVNLPCLV